MAKAKRSTNKNTKAMNIAGPATGMATDYLKNTSPQDALKAAAAALGRFGGLKGGKARAKKLTPKRRKEIAKKAAAARWNKK